MKRPPAILTAPWCISEEGLHLVRAIWSRAEMHPDVLAKMRAERPGPYSNQSRPAYTVKDGIATIPISGPLFRKASLLTDVSGATSDEMIASSLSAAVADPLTRGIVLDLDSPGGEARGSSETAEAIRTADAVKPVIAYSGGQACSKAFWYASACRKIVAAEDAQLGSIGCRIGLVDDSKADEAEGLRYIDLTNDDSPDKRSWPIDEAVVAGYKRELNALAGIFIAHVARGRNQTPDYVIANFGRGGVLTGQAALAVGMIDHVGSMAQARAIAGEVSRGITTNGSPLARGAAAVAREVPAASRPRAVLIALARATTKEETRDALSELASLGSGEAAAARALEVSPNDAEGILRRALGLGAATARTTAPKVAESGANARRLAEIDAAMGIK